MFSINSLNGNSFFDIGLQYGQMQIKELGDESFNVPQDLRDIEKSSLSSSGDSSFSNFVKSFNDLHSLITAYIFKTDANMGDDKELSNLRDEINKINQDNINKKIIEYRNDHKESFRLDEDELKGLYGETTDIDASKIKMIFDNVAFVTYVDADPVLKFLALDNALLITEKFIKSLKINGNNQKQKDFVKLIEQLKEEKGHAYGRLEDFLKDDKDKLISSARDKIDLYNERNRSSRNIGELNSLNDSVLIASDLYDLLSKNFSVWNSLILSKDIILKKGDSQPKIKEDSSEIIEVLTKEKYVKEDQNNYKNVLKYAKLLDVLIQQLGKNEGVNGSVNAHQFLGNTSFPTRGPPSTGFNTNPPHYESDNDNSEYGDDDYEGDSEEEDSDDEQEYDSLEESEEEAAEEAAEEADPARKVQSKIHKQDIVFIDSVINVKRSKQDIIYNIPQDSLKKMRYVDKTEGKLKKTTRNELVSLAHNYYIDNEADARKFVKHNTRLVK